MNRSIAPEIKESSAFTTGFIESENNIFHFDGSDGVFKLEIIYPYANRIGISNPFAYTIGLDLLFSGTVTKTASQIAEDIDQYGGFIFKNSDYYTSSISIYGLEENIENILPIVKNAIDEAFFPEEEILVYKRNKISELKINLQKTSFLANRGINKLLFGDNHTVNKILTEDVINNTLQSELISFKNNQLLSPYFIFTGSKSINVINLLADIGFEILPKINMSNIDEIPSGVELELIIPKSDSTQSSIRFGKILPEREHPDFFKISILNTLLGGYFGSRLMKNIREDKGLTYGIHSSISPYKKFSVLKISSECNNKNSALVKTEILREIKKLREELVGQEELITVKNYLTGVLQRNFDGVFNISDRFKTFVEMNMDAHYYNNYLKAIQNITSQEILDTAYNYFKENTFKYCLAGD